MQTITPFCSFVLVKVLSPAPLLIVTTLWSALASLKIVQDPEPLTTPARLAGTPLPRLANKLEMETLAPFLGILA